MSLSSTEVDNIFESIVLQVQDPALDLKASMEEFKPEDPTRMEWRFELRGFVRGLALLGKLDETAIARASRLMHQPISKPNRPGRDHQYSVDVHASGPDQPDRTFQFNVAAMNPMDAYVQLTKRLVYRTIPDVYRVDVFEDFLSERKTSQDPIRIFDKDELIFVKHDGP